MAAASSSMDVSCLAAAACFLSACSSAIMVSAGGREVMEAFAQVRSTTVASVDKNGSLMAGGVWQYSTERAVVRTVVWCFQLCLLPFEPEIAPVRRCERWRLGIPGRPTFGQTWSQLCTVVHAPDSLQHDVSPRSCGAHRRASACQANRSDHPATAK